MTAHPPAERASTSYVPIVATVVESGIVATGRGRGWRARVTYRYEVDGREWGQDDAGTAFAFGLIGAMMLFTWLHRRRARRDAA
ncbi:MAG: hypothetical protein DMD70_05435 [Gemmatimonadetes bacterium]|nr:MAG: hypothetical protein DMD70_05435 [Gemmatimonadota bacterium]